MNFGLKMDVTVDNFLKEINEIVPPKHAEKVIDCEWQECFDDKSGFAYYWNIKTDEVTWEMPPLYKQWLEKKSALKTATLFPPPLPSDVKIYKISEETLKTDIKASLKGNNGFKYAKKREYPKHYKSDSEDERIVLISSYGSDTDSEAEEIKTPKKKITLFEEKKSHGNKILNKPSNKTELEETDEENLLMQIQSKAKELKELGGELPLEVKEIVEVNPVPNKNMPHKKSLTGFSLVAGYGDSEEEQEEMEEIDKKDPENSISHSTLFPITKPIDIKQFTDTLKVEQHSDPQTPEVINNKAFQRKRRIGVNLVNIKKKPKPDENNSSDKDNSQRQGLGFSITNYPGFKSGGVLFSKGDQPDHRNNEIKPNDSKSDDDENSVESLEETRVKLSEKLTFLSEGKEAASAIQIMLIQLETLYAALKAGSLAPNYLQKWLEDMCTELVKLEQEAAPSGWLLQWDRSQKRYYYYNKENGQSQWDYPESDIVRSDDAMDISTTPPPLLDEKDETLNMDPPPPPSIRKLNTPPAPNITDSTTDSSNIPLPHFPGENAQPLPPGVEMQEVVPEGTTSETLNDCLTSVLDSFYSDIAALESISNDNVVSIKEVSTVKLAELPTGKKKKTKVKLTQGLAMKKKGVSKLVEKWKNVQKNYD